MKIKNMKLRSSLMRETSSNTESAVVAIVDSVYGVCDDSVISKLSLMNIEEFPIKSAEFLKINEYQYQMNYEFNNNLSKTVFTIVGPFSQSIKFNINDYELRKVFTNGTCFPLLTLRNKNSPDNTGFEYGQILNSQMNGSLNSQMNGSPAVGSNKIDLPVTFIVYNQEGFYYYLKVDKDSKVRPSDTFSDVIGLT